MNDTVLERPEFVVGHFPDLPEDIYRRVSAMSYSGAKKMNRSPAHYRLAIDEPSAPLDSMLFGSSCHLGVLQPDLLSTRVVGAPKMDKRTNAGKAAWESFCADNSTRIILSAADFDRARRVIDAVHAHPTAQELLHGAQIEGSMFWYDGATGMKCKCRYDARNLGGLIDLKTCADASPSEFARSAANLGYNLQAWAYMSGAEHVLNATPEFWIWIAVESEKPHAVAIYQADTASLLAGARLWDQALQRYKTALASGTWPGYDERIQPLTFPKWATSFAAGV